LNRLKAQIGGARTHPNLNLDANRHQRAGQRHKSFHRPAVDEFPEPFRSHPFAVKPRRLSGGKSIRNPGNHELLLANPGFLDS